MKELYVKLSFDRKVGVNAVLSNILKNNILTFWVHELNVFTWAEYVSNMLIASLLSVF